MDGLDLVIFGVPLVMLTAGGVEAIKGLGLPHKWAPVASVCVGSGIVALNGIRLGAETSARVAAEWALLGVVYGLAASGLYDHAERLFAVKPKGSPEVSGGESSTPTHYSPGHPGRHPLTCPDMRCNGDDD